MYQSTISFGYASSPGPVPYFPFFDATFGSVSGSLILQGQLLQGSSDKNTENHLSRLWFICAVGGELRFGAAGGGGGRLPGDHGGPGRRVRWGFKEWHISAWYLRRHIL